MGKAFLALAIVAVFTSSAMALAFPTLVGVPPGLATLTQSDSQITLGTPSSPVGYAVGVGTSPVPGNDCVLSTTLHFDPANPTELGLVARANVSLGEAYSTSLNPLNGYLALDKLAAQVAVLWLRPPKSRTSTAARTMSWCSK